MTATVPERPIILRRVQMSAAAWALLCESTSATLGLPNEQPAGAQAAPLEEEAAAAAWAELNSLDISPGPGEVKRQWMGAVALLLTAPITVTARATYNGVSTTSVLGLRAGRGLAAHQRHLSERAGQGTVITGSEDSMEITLFDEENVWGAAARLLPPLDVVRAAAKAAPLDAKPAAVLGAGTDPATLPEPVASLVNDEDANITLSVVTAMQGMPTRIWAGMWSVKDDRLYSVTTRVSETPELRLTEVPAGHIANELVFAVVGAHDALAAAQKEAAK
ncbi:hypothetical protein [Arthrobacter alpinus]|uniref:hypothetical protein n=1 Tax=Arthrobacter alpinus TaxID=656366 RepID=UPI001645F866|nr:hypothetical protein [Arthrobacter alpinus]